MNTERNQDNPQQQTGTSNDTQNQRNSPFNETKQGDDKSTENPEQEADLEQQRKEALTERD